MKRLIFLLLICSYGWSAEAQTASVPMTLQEAKERFLQKNLLLLAERYNIEIAEAEVTQARLFENPVISVDHNIYNRLSGRYFEFGSEGQTEVEIEQVIYLAGQRNKRVKLEKINKETAVFQFEEVLRTLSNELNKQFIELYYALNSQTVYDREIESVKHLLTIYQEQYEKGNIPLLEKSRLQSFLLSLQQERNELTEQIISLQSEIRLLTGLSVQENPIPLWEESWLQQIDISTISLPELLSYLPDRPDLKMAGNAIKASKADVRLQRSLGFPEFSLRGTYDRASGIYDNYFAIGLSLSVPLFNRNQGAIRSAKSTVLQNNILEQYAYDQAGNEMAAAYFRLEKAIELYQLSNNGLEEDFGKLLEGVSENFRKRNISLLEFIDYYQAYKETYLQLYSIRKELIWAVEDINTLTGNTFFSYYE